MKVQASEEEPCTYSLLSIATFDLHGQCELIIGRLLLPVSTPVIWV